MEDGNNDAGDRERPVMTREDTIRKCVAVLTHTSRCQVLNCETASCLKMRRVIKHVKTCKKRTKGGCPACKQLLSLCVFHVKGCEVDQCDVLFCTQLKPQLKTITAQRLQQRAQNQMRQRSEMKAIEMALKKLNVTYFNTATIAASVAKEWHANTPETLRSHLVGKLAQSSTETPIVLLRDDRRESLLKRAKEIEHAIFENADCQSQYFSQLADEIYKAQKEIQVNKIKRVIEHETIAIKHTELAKKI